MFPRLLFTVAIAVNLTGLYVLYSMAMQTVVVVPIRPEQEIEDDGYNEFQRPAENVRVATTYIPTEEWAAKSRYMVKVKPAFIYTEHWKPEPENNKQVRFEKFAMV